MAPSRRIEDFAHHEFRVVLAQSGRDFEGIAWDTRGNVVLQERNACLEQLKQDMKAGLNERSQSFVGFDQAIKLFRRVFPGGFARASYRYRERDYKLQTVTLIEEGLSLERIDSDVGAGRSDRVVAAAEKVMKSSNLCHPRFERPLILKALKTPGMAAHFPLIMRQALYGDFETGAERLAAHLRPHGANDWPVLTFWTFFRFPDQHMFLRPGVTITCAERLGFAFDYAEPWTSATYKSLLEFTDFVRDGIAELAPADNIDIQSFIYVVGSNDYVRKALADPARAERVRRES